MRLAAAACAAFLVFALLIGCSGRGKTTSGKQKTLLVEVHNRHSWPLDVGVWSDLGLAPGLPTYYFSGHHGDQTIPPGTSAFWRIYGAEKLTRIAVIVDPKTPYWWATTFRKQPDFPNYFLRVVP